MADAHVGIGSTIGSVIPTTGAIIPAAIGVDIGCGMIAVETDLTASDLPDDLGRLHSRIAEVIPAGVGHGHNFISDKASETHSRGIPSYSGRSKLSLKQINKITNQFGTLGSGNHFVEVSLDEREAVWLVLHSGSRSIGNQLATSHIEKAKGLMKQMFISLKDPDLAYLLEGTPEFDAYIADMLWSQAYAAANRDAMMNALLTAVQELIGRGKQVSRINCHHNYTVRENHHGQDVWLTRKGAIRARVGDMGVIPGSMGTNSYIVEGLGNPSSYCSASHGAGRRLSRKAARNGLTVESLDSLMIGVEWNKNDANKLLDEHPEAYKDIDQVMSDQSDLVKIVHTLHQVLNYKGT